MQVESMDDDLRNSLWNVLVLGVFDSKSIKETLFSTTDSIRIKRIFTLLWIHDFKNTYDSMPNHPRSMYDELRKYFFSCKWYEVFDIIEAILKYLENEDHLIMEINDVESWLNEMLERENSAYRFINGVACEIIDSQAIEQVVTALEDEDFPQVKTHLSRALELMSDKQHPDYRNSIKESISAVESIAILLSGKEKATLGDALAEIERNDKIHPSLKKGFSCIYGYTSDDDGIRHALMEESNLEKTDAHLFFLLCTVFVNYLKTKF